MAEKRTETNSYTIIFAIVMVIIVGALLAFVASSLSDKIALNKRIEKQQNILYALGVNNDEKPYSGAGSVEFIDKNQVQESFKKHIVKEYVCQDGEITETPDAYLIDLKKEEAKAKNPNYKMRLPLLVGEKDGKTYYVIALRGKGLWDAVWGYMALDHEFRVEGAFFDHAGETPGLGANIKERFFMDDFHGEKVLRTDGSYGGVTIIKGNMDPLNKDKDDHEVDAIAGATITGDGVSKMISTYLQKYLPYLQKLNKE